MRVRDKMTKITDIQIDIEGKSVCVRVCVLKRQITKITERQRERQKRDRKLRRGKGGEGGASRG